MEVVYLFYESTAIRIPFYYGLRQFYQPIIQAGGYWDNAQKEFIFWDDVGFDLFSTIFRGIICVQVMNDTSIPLKILGLKDYPWDDDEYSCLSTMGATNVNKIANTTVIPQQSNAIPLQTRVAPLQTNTIPLQTRVAPLQINTIPQQTIATPLQTRAILLQTITTPLQKDPVLPNESPSLPEAIFKMPTPSSPEKLDEKWRIRLESELRARKYSPSTRKAYIYYNCLLCRTLQKTPEEIHAEDITQFLAEMEKDRKYSASAMNLAISAVKFFFRNILKNDDISEQHRPRHDGRLPIILSKDEISKILSMEQNPKHRLLLMLVYSSGLRVSEVVALKREHIDISRHAIYVRLGKGRKDRCTILSEKVANFITEYCSFFDIKTWLFPGQPPTRPLTIRSAQHIFDKAIRRAKIPKNISIHGLRHTFATHLLESGTDIRYIQSLLGHANLRTTERYTHVARRSVLSIKSPLDTIP